MNWRPKLYYEDPTTRQAFKKACHEVIEYNARTKGSIPVTTMIWLLLNPYYPDRVFSYVVGLELVRYNNDNTWDKYEITLNLADPTPQLEQILFGKVYFYHGGNNDIGHRLFYGRRMYSFSFSRNNLRQYVLACAQLGIDISDD